MQGFLENNMAVQWSKAILQLSLPDLNLLDSSILDILQVKNATTHPNKDSLRRTIHQDWDWLSKARFRRICWALGGD
jgi:hypothetical protein